MKGNILLVIGLILFGSTNCLAQHCPFDGTSIIMVKITGNNTLQKNKYEFTLQEIENPTADTCKYAKGLLLRKRFTRYRFSNNNNKVRCSGYRNVKQHWSVIVVGRKDCSCVSRSQIPQRITFTCGGKAARSSAVDPP